MADPVALKALIKSKLEAKNPANYGSMSAADRTAIADGWFESIAEAVVEITDADAGLPDVFSDYLTGGFQLGKGGAAPTLTTFRDSIKLPAFGGTGSADEGFFEFHILHDLKVGTTPTLHVHFGNNAATPSGDVKWNLAVSAARGYGGIFPAEALLSVVHTVTTQYAHEITDDDAMALPAALVAILEPDTKVIGRIWRDPSDGADTSTQDAFFMGIDMHYVRGQTGTTERNRPFTSAGFPT